MFIIYDHIMVRPTVEETRMLFFLALTTFLIIITCSTILFTRTYGFTYTPTENSTISPLSNYAEKYFQIQAAHDSGLLFPEYIHQVSMGAGNPENASALADYKAIQEHMQTIEKSIFICNAKEYDFIISDAGFKFCIDQSAFAYETCGGDPDIYKSVCNNAIIENILKTVNPSVQDLNDRAYDEAQAALGNSAIGFPIPAVTPNVAAFSVYENTEQKIKVQYPSDWKKYMESTIGETFSVEFISPEPANPNGRASFSITIDNTDKSSLQDYKNSQIERLKGDFSAVHVTNLTGPWNRTLSGIPAYKIYFVSPIFGGLQTSEIIAIKDGKVYTIAYQAKLKTFEKHFDQFQKMVDSFQLIG